MTKIEEVALALQEEAEGPQGNVYDPRPLPSYIRLAIAAVGAMREPNEAMINAAPEEGIDYNKNSRGYAANYFRAMIDAALAEHKG